MEAAFVTHQTLNGRYKIQIERAASTKGVLGYKVEANGDVLADVLNETQRLKDCAELIAGGPQIENKMEVK